MNAEGLREQAINEGCDVQFDDVIAVCDELIALRKQAALDRQSREASQAEFARLNRELNQERETAQKLAVLLDEAYTALAASRRRERIMEPPEDD